MTYLLETLGDERFQQLCQALLTIDFPDVQCLPIRQPDGGRDALRRVRNGCIIFQVKFVSEPNTKEAREAIIQLLKSEKEKIETLKKRGATRYYFLTNVPGTGHLDSGSIDKLDSFLGDNLGIPSFCWWRDDIERRVDCAHEIKWSYPEILKGSDVLSALINTGQDPEAKRRTSAIRSYMAAQSRSDAQLKFKQIDLQKDIFDLFVDIPAKLLAAPGDDDREHASNWLQFLQDCKVDLIEDDGGPDSSVGALELLVSAFFGSAIDRLVVEGAPGQGKSTITQYLCQVNRLKLFGENNAKVSKNHVPTVARIPFRVDLRDYASWLAGRDPFSDEPAIDTRINGSPLLESFIAAQIRRLTGMTFTVDDLSAVAAISRILIVLDGFDEVAEIKLRNRIVAEVSEAAVRLKANAISSQIVVTSRPAVFSNSPGFPRDEWRHLAILPLTPSIIEGYAQRWLDGRQVDDKEKRNILSVLQDKIAHPHVRDLARNPMQLSILLALISVQGASLPDKRTALYDEYIKIFLNRESEKSAIVRDHRDLLVQIHRYLAWVLQSEAESEGSGNISDTRLKQMLGDYLCRTGNSTDLVEKLFTGMVERVVALVSRIQGTFEFEVQPLREYFAARYLYNTAPNAPATIAKGVGKPERFEAIARNFYWLNVTRFYAGCYTDGELASLIDGLRDLRNDARFKLIGYPAELALVLLGDYVFNSQPRIATKLSEEIGQSLNFPICIAETQGRRGSPIRISPVGSKALENSVVSLLLDRKEKDVRRAAGYVLSNSWPVEKRYKFWCELRESIDNVKEWLEIGSYLSLYRDLSKDRLSELVDIYGGDVFLILLNEERLDVVDHRCEAYWARLMDPILSQQFSFQYIAATARTSSVEGVLAGCLGLVLCPFIWEESASWHSDNQRARRDTPIGDILVEIFFTDGAYDVHRHRAVFAQDATYRRVYFAISEVLSQTIDQIMAGSSWSRMIEECRAVWGDRACIIGAVCNFVDALSMDGVALQLTKAEPNSMVHQALLARQNAERPDWWDEKLRTQGCSSGAQKRFFLTCVLRWMPMELIFAYSDSLSRLTDELEASNWVSVSDGLDLVGRSNRRCKVRLKKDSLPSILSPRLASLLLRRLNKDDRSLIWRNFLRSYDGSEKPIWHSVASIAVECANSTGSWRRAMATVSKAYGLGVTYHFFRHRTGEHSVSAIPSSIAEMICADPRKYPISAICAAAEVLTADAGGKSEPVATVAARDGWFAELE